MANKYRDLRQKMSPESRAKSERIFRDAIRQMPLHELLNIIAEFPSGSITINQFGAEQDAPPAGPSTEGPS